MTTTHDSQTTRPATFVAFSPATGDCGHRHQTAAAAQRCADRFNDERAMMGGVADRAVRAAR